MKETPYFSHDYNPTNDPKMSALIAEYGAVGYGIYWCIVEMMHQEDVHKLPEKQYIYIAIAKQMQANDKQYQVSAEQVESIVKHCILVCELFVSDGSFFFSGRVMRNFDKRAEISEKRSFAGKMGAIAKQNKASAKQNLAKPSKEKEIKRKEKKTTIAFVPPSFEDFEKYCTENQHKGIALRAFKGYSEADWHDTKGSQIRNWKQKMQNCWFLEDNKDHEHQTTMNLSEPVNYNIPRMPNELSTVRTQIIKRWPVLKDNDNFPDSNDDKIWRWIWKKVFLEEFTPDVAKNIEETLKNNG